MKQDIHPQYEEITATCSCGNEIKVCSTLCKNLQLDVCSNCHPFYTGTQKMMDTGGRIERFQKRFGTLNTRR
ncbi:MAG: 50S ribosomal protein L31 [Endozoicomonadaceae bacterium]|nr:50S ribosomal protein L31 [Endozoicomonadaceae bacterium]